MSTSIQITWHAACRQASRNLSHEDIHFVLEHGQRIRSAGALHVFLGRRNIPSDKTIYRRFARLEGTVLVLDDTGHEIVLITTYRNRRSAKRIRVKTKYGRSPFRMQHIKHVASA
jgi:hypothetical protein